MIGLTMTGIGPHRGTPGTIIMIVLLIFFFSNTYCLFTVKPPMTGLKMTWNMPFFLYFLCFFFVFFFFPFYRRTTHDQACDDRRMFPSTKLTR